MSKHKKHAPVEKQGGASNAPAFDLEDAVIAELCERIGPEALAEILREGMPGAGEMPVGAKDPFVAGAEGCSPSDCASCPSKTAGSACGFPQKPVPACEELEEEPLVEPTEEERAAILALDYAAVAQALNEEEPVTVAVTTGFIVQYSLKVAQALREGNEFLHVVNPTESTPAIECIAMAIVRESVAESLAQESSGRYNA